MKIYLDSDFRCHLTDDGTMQAVETDVFDGRERAYIECYRYVPEGQVWTRDDGVEFHGLMVAPAKDYNRIMVDVAIGYLDDAHAESVSTLFDEWHSGVAYAVGDRRKYDGLLYRPQLPGDPRHFGRAEKGLTNRRGRCKLSLPVVVRGGHRSN